MLGHEQTKWDKFINIVTYPKYNTSHYNQNGKSIYRSKLTIITFFAMFVYLNVMGFKFIIPLFAGMRMQSSWRLFSGQIFSNAIHSTTYETWQLGNPLNLKSNATWEDNRYVSQMGGADSFWQKYFVS